MLFMGNVLSATGLCRVSFAVYEQMKGTFSSRDEAKGYRRRFLLVTVEKHNTIQ